jgi:DNA-binding CsgD family transcriptional regulator
VLRDRGSAWGGLVFFRATTASDLTDAEVAFVADVGADLARAVRRCLLYSEHMHRDQPAGPGVALLSVDGMDVEVDMVSRAAQRWLAEVADGRLQPSALPLTVVTLAQRAVRSPTGRTDLRLRARSGRWLTLHAEAVDEDAGDGPERPATQRVSLVVEPTRPHELAEVIGEAYALSPREREVARLAVAGLSNREIAAALWLSVYTVQDHLKAVFAKLGVRNRAELTSRMFFDQYLQDVLRRLLGSGLPPRLPAAHEASIHINYPLVANAVMEVDEFLAAVSTTDPGSVQAGDTVVGSDRGKIGEVEEVVTPHGETPGYLRVPRGVIFDKDTFIPLDTVVHRGDGRVYLNVPKLVVGKLPWDPAAVGGRHGRKAWAGRKRGHPGSTGPITRPEQHAEGAV